MIIAIHCDLYLVKCLVCVGGSIDVDCRLYYQFAYSY